MEAADFFASKDAHIVIRNGHRGAAPRANMVGVNSGQGEDDRFRAFDQRIVDRHDHQRGRGRAGGQDAKIRHVALRAVGNFARRGEVAEIACKTFW